MVLHVPPIQSGWVDQTGLKVALSGCTDVATEIKSIAQIPVKPGVVRLSCDAGAQRVNGLFPGARLHENVARGKAFAHIGEIIRMIARQNICRLAKKGFADIRQ